MRLDFLPGKKRTIYQRPDFFTYSMDSILLGRFVTLRGGKRLLDLCAGTGAVPLALSVRTTALIDAVELQEPLCRLMEASVSENGLEEQIHVHEADLRTMHPQDWGVYDVVTCNPPYFPVTAEKGVNETEARTLARHEVACTLEDVVKTAARMVRSRGRAAFIHRPERLTELMQACEANGLQPKRLQFVHPSAAKEANMVLLEAVKDGGSGMTVECPLLVYGEDGAYEPSFKERYFEGEDPYA
ncbi:tRNA1(Val) (adenine(37)-N6)-methyltransferase [Alkalicoccus urumqiensis]|uniref:SAM-dependent methyltransferase n=1 Tax=Alkalicoccus urumqiensis TaxID=1548213 RepID=A0A2P6MDL4_ALKUR|nr:tRNA1(Val) (adenine(37)-N6)-methyltransferase [Alkalicoccus urumqiensis]PRO64381.1 SAM-dependent methyltransferase [Alkalicoccus urumqiensis]